MRKMKGKDAGVLAGKLGTLWVSLLALEFSLRKFLFDDELTHTDYSSVGEAFPQFASLDSVMTDERLPLNAFTNYDTLGLLIDKYNSRVQHAAPELCVDAKLVDIRNAIAHGRMFTLSLDGPVRIVKFSKPESGDTHVRATFNVALTAHWLDLQVRRVLQATWKVNEANKHLQGERNTNV